MKRDVNLSRQNEIVYLDNGELSEIDDTQETIEVIVKYVSDLDNISSELGLKVELLDRNYAIIQVPISNVELLINYQNIIYVELPQDVAPLQNLYSIDICKDEQFGISKDLTGEGVLVSIIDSGIDYTHQDFINDDGTTRIEAIWDQSINTGTKPEGFLEGTLFTKEQINQALSSGEPLEHIDNNGHGTAVAGVCCGNGRESMGAVVGVAPKSDILVVKLSSKGVGVAKTTDIMRAIKFSYDYAIGINKPIVINLSFGTSNGVRSGETLFETYINEVAESYMSNIVVAMGNEGNTGRHYSNKLETGESVIVEFNIQSGITTFNLIVFKRFIDDISMEIISPTGETTGIFNLTNTREVINVDDYIIFINAGSPRPYTVETGIYIAFQNLGDIRDNELWHILLFGENIINGSIDMWLPIYELVGQNSFFFEAALETTLTIPATVKNVISVAGYNQESNSIVGFSGRGNTINNGLKPDIASPSVEIITTKSGGGYDAYTGTSFAAPIVTGIVALLLEWGIVDKNDQQLYGQRLKAYLQKGARRPEEFMGYPNIEIGYGLVCLDNTLDLLRDENRDVTYSRMGNLFANILEATDEENVILSENYIDFIAEYDEKLIESINQSGYAYISKIIQDKYIIMSVRADMYNDAVMNLFISYKRETSSLFSLCGVGALNASGIVEVQNNEPLQLTGRNVLIGIVDTGIDYTNASFIDDIGETRIVSIWDQTQEGTRPLDFTYGREITRDEINQALNDGVVDLTTDEKGHGTFLASTIGGSKVSEVNFGVATNCEIVAVKLKPAKSIQKLANFVSDDVDDIYQSTDVLQGIDYLVRKAELENKPIAICIGLSTNSGAHDSTTFIERYLQQICLSKEIFVSCAVGDEVLKRRHAEISIMENESTNFIFEVGNDNRICVDVWIKYFEEIEIIITTPNGAKTSIIPINQSFTRTKIFTDQNSEIYIIYDRFLNAGSKNFIRIGLITPESGTWSIEIKGINIIDGDVNIWLPTGNMISDETYIINASIENTATIPSSTDGICSVGGYNHRNNSMYSASGRGGNVYKSVTPSLLAPSVEVLGSYPLFIDVMTGTSVGSAITCGCGALLLEWGVVKENLPIMNTEIIRNILIKGCVREMGVKYPNITSGYGRLNLIDSFKELV